MSKNEQISMFDGFTVSIFDGKFTGTFDLDDSVAEDMAFDDVVTFIVTARIGGATIGETKKGDMKRTNHFLVTSANALDRPMAEKVLNSIGAAVNGVNAGQQTLPPTTPIHTGPIVDEPEPDDDHAMVGRPVHDPLLQRFLDGGV